MASTLFQDKKVGIVGLGKIGSAILKGMLRAELVDREQFRATTGHAESRRVVERDYQITVRENNAALALDCDVIVVAVKPHRVEQVLTEMASALDASTLVVSVAAGIPLALLERSIANAEVPVVRAMPNLCAAILEGMTGYSMGQATTEEHEHLAEAMFSSIGRAVAVDEELLDAVTGLAASGPAFMFVIIESLAEAGVKVGLPRDVALTMAEQMVLGSARLALETGEHPAKLKEDITTPAGTTIDGILELEEGKLRVTLIKAVVKATERARALSQKLKTS